MASIVDELMAREGTLVPGMEGITIARAADRHWVREQFESERDFIDRIRSEAAADGYCVVATYGAIQVSDGARQ